jgi:hypothetical protein
MVAYGTLCYKRYDITFSSLPEQKENIPLEPSNVIIFHTSQMASKTHQQKLLMKFEPNHLTISCPFS